MGFNSLKVFLAIGLTAFFANDARAQVNELPCEFGTASGSRWAAAWCELKQIQNFSAGEHFCFHVVGSKQVLARFKPFHVPPQSGTGIDGGPRDVPKSGMLLVTTSRPHRQIDQISVHGGETAFEGFNFTPSNGAPRLFSITLMKNPKDCK